MRVAEYGSGVEAGPAGTRPRRFGGFTLTELMAVMLIMMVLVGLVVGVSRWIQMESARQETISIQAIIKEAILEYNIQKNVYPPDSPIAGTKPSALNDSDWTAATRIAGLFKELKGVEKSESIIRKIQTSRALMYWNWICPKCSNANFHAGDSCDVTNKCTGKRPATATEFRMFIDGFSKWMDYSRSGGLGNTPVIISAGPDRDFTTPSDNVRSDEGY